MEKVKKENCSKPRWNLNDQYLFLSPDFVLSSIFES